MDAWRLSGDAAAAHEFHDHHEMAVSTLHVQLDPARCLEIAVLRGSVGELRQMADHVIAERGVRHGQLVLFPQAEPA